MCSTPVWRRIECYEGGFFEIPVSCRKCGECLNAKRAEWVYRIRAELESECVSRAFITFTYDNDHLPFVGNSAARRSYVQGVMSLPLGQRNWDFAVINPSHVTKLIKDLQSWFANAYRELMYDKKKRYHKDGVKYTYTYYVKPEFKGVHLLRYYLTSEYGCLDHRPHVHILLMSPQMLHLSDFEKMAKDCWRYGDVFVEDISDLGAADYVAKHQVKVDRGSEYQREVSPNLRRVSVAFGGLGRSLKDSEELYLQYYHQNGNEEYDQRCIDYFSDNGQIVHLAFPEFLSKFFRLKKHGYEDRHMTKYEFAELERVLFQDFFDKIYSNYLDNKDLFANFVRRTDETFVDFYYRVMVDKDMKQREDYQLQYYYQHEVSRLNKHRAGVNYDLNS